MQLNRHQTRQLLKNFEFETLLTEELGWDHHKGEVKAEIREGEGDESEYLLIAIAQKRGMGVFLCPAGPDGNVPDYAIRRKIQREVAKSVYEHIIIYAAPLCPPVHGGEKGGATQIWQWVKREQGKPAACREHRYHSEQSGESLIQKLETIAFSLDEEEDLTLPDVTGRVQAAFDVERITKRFYDRFKTEHARFLKFLNGIPDQEMERWYASVMLNRLMFIYFIQKKGFLNDDTDYLRTQLKETQVKGTDRYYTDFLCPLFFEGFAKPEPERSGTAKRLLGKVPYLNGGIFQRHQLEEMEYPPGPPQAGGKEGRASASGGGEGRAPASGEEGRSIQIADAAFEGLFDFFDAYEWHLDERPLRSDNEINPDVLGYIFEKYINQKQMGAYYTKEDITEYISKNTVIPFLFDAARKACKIAFEPVGGISDPDASGGGISASGGGISNPDSVGGSVWQLLRADPNRYIYDAVKRGVELDLPEHIAAGIDDVSKRTMWNEPAPNKYALPTEIWRETVARRNRYEKIHAKLSNGEIDDINALITYNLNIRQFAHDVIENCEGPELLRAFWKAITEVTILDPTCGSGAFLFAALNILEPLYEVCLNRMQTFLDELEHFPRGSDLRSRIPEKFSDFRKILENIEQHPNRRYFILKSIIINNLYGVDIMEEAIEICKLRLFLKMVAQIEEVKQIEPLPDIDFNIQAGNTLVGYATYDEVEKAVTGKLDFDNTINRIKESAEDIEQLFNLFRQQQTDLGGAVRSDDKQVLRDKLKALEDELNRFLADEYKVDLNKQAAYQSWLSSHKPFHWFIEFYGILKNGGFDVIIGNPPYVSIRKIDYTSSLEERLKLPDLYGYVLIRSLDLSSDNGRNGMIIPLSITFSRDFSLLRESLYVEGISWFSSFDKSPASIFAGVNQRCSIWIGCKCKSIERACFSSPMYRWRSITRSCLIDRINYVKIAWKNNKVLGIPKIHDTVLSKVLDIIDVRTHKPSQRVFALPKETLLPLYFSSLACNFISVFKSEPPCLDAHTLEIVSSSSIQKVNLHRKTNISSALAVLSGEIFFWYWLVRGDGFHLTIGNVSNFLKILEKLSPEYQEYLGMLGACLHNRRYEALVFKKNAGKYVGNFNYQGQFPITRRSDLLLLAGLDLDKNTALTIFDNVQRILSINEFAGEKSIPQAVKQKFPPSNIDSNLESDIFAQLDRLIVDHYGFTDEELDFIINYDIKYRMGLGN